MLTKQDIVDLIPRIAWGIHLLLIFVLMNSLKETPSIEVPLVLVLLTFVLIMVGAYLFISTAIIILKYRKKFSPTKIFVEGPYLYIRHPMYLGIYLLLFGFGILLKLKSVFIVSIPMIPVWYALSKLEEKEMTKRFGKQYLEYKEKTGMFFPKIKIHKE